VIEDFHVRWTHHAAHVLPVTRFLQDVGARRAAAALRAADAIARAAAGNRIASAAGVAAPSAASTSAARTEPALAAAAVRGASSVGDLLGHYSRVARNAVQTAFAAVDRSRVDRVTMLVTRLMAQRRVSLTFGSGFARGGSTWIHKFSRNATDALLYGGVRAVVLHWADPFAPIPLTPEESAFTRAFVASIEAAARGGTGGSPLTADRADPRHPEPPLTAAQAAARAAADAAGDAFAAAVARAHPDVGVLSVVARCGPEAFAAQRLGVEGALPKLELFDVHRGYTDLPAVRGMEDVARAVAAVGAAMQGYAAAAASAAAL
jgi:hypothetical protein